MIATGSLPVRAGDAGDFEVHGRWQRLAKRWARSAAGLPGWATRAGQFQRR